MKHDKRALYETGQAHRVAVSPVSNGKDLLENPQLEHLLFWKSLWHPELNGEVIYPDLNPRGLTPGEFVPKEVSPEDLHLSPPIQEAPQTAPSDSRRKLPPNVWDSLPEGGFPAEPAPKESSDPAPKRGRPTPAVKQTSWASPPPSEAPRRYRTAQGLVSTDFSVPLRSTEPPAYPELPPSEESEPPEPKTKHPFLRFLFAKP